MTEAGTCGYALLLQMGALYQMPVCHSACSKLEFQNCHFTEDLHDVQIRHL